VADCGAPCVARRSARRATCPVSAQRDS
jgi:hypothetical protein